MQAACRLFLEGAALALALFAALIWFAVAMPGRPFRGPLPAASGDELERRLRDHVEALAGDIGERNADHAEQLGRAARYIETELGAAGAPVRSALLEELGEHFRNLELEIPGTGATNESVIIGAHYDSVSGSPGANDNGSGVAVLLELARMLRGHKPTRTLRLVAFVNEEPPFFQTERMGSFVYAHQAAERGERIAAMISIETVGYFRSEPGTLVRGLRAVITDLCE